MAHAYTPGLKVVEESVVKKERRLPLKGEVIVNLGDRVKAEDIVARTFLPGNVEMVNVVNKLGIEPSEIKASMLKKEGDLVKRDEIIAESKSFFGLFKSQCASPVTGVIESISNRTGQVTLREPAIPVEITAYIDGIIDEVIEKEGVIVKTVATFVQGIFGVGGEITGDLILVAKSPSEVLKADQITDVYKDKIIIGGSLVTSEVINKAIKIKAKGIIAGGIDDKDLKDFLGYDLGVAITGNEEKGITIVVTEGFGEISMADKTYALLKGHSGKKASINGATQIRAGVIRPEVIVPIAKKEEEIKKAEEEGESLGMVIGGPLRIIRQPHFGAQAKVVSLPVELQKMESETKVRVVEIELVGSGERLVLPRANVELIESL